MTSWIRSFWRLTVVSLIAASGLMAAGAAQAQNTTASLRVLVSDQDGVNLVGVNVRVSHVPTGRSLTLTSNAAGVVTARGLAVGGPYEVAVAEAGHPSHTPAQCQ